MGVDTEIIGYIDLPALSIRLPVYMGASDKNMRKGAAHLSKTSLPIGGINTNAVITAHRNYSRAAMFRDMQKLSIDDELYFTNFWQKFTYEVSEIRVVNPDRVDKILIRQGKDMLTLITCHPYRYDFQRYPVFCERVCTD